MGTLIIRLVEHLRLRARAGGGGTCGTSSVMQRKAPRLLRPGEAGRASAHAVELFAGVLAEITRTKGVGDRRAGGGAAPGRGERTPRSRWSAGCPLGTTATWSARASNLDEDQSRQVVSLPGVAAVFGGWTPGPGHGAVRRGPGGGRARPARRLVARRGPACGPSARGGAPAPCWTCAGPNCSPHRAHRARPGEPGEAWLRLWRGDAGAGHFLTGHGQPAVPARLRSWSPDLDRRLRECLLATVLDRTVLTGRWPSGPPTTRAALAARPASGRAAGCSARARGRARGGAGLGESAGALAARDGAGMPPGRPRTRSRRPCAATRLRPAGLAGWPGMRMGHRLRGAAPPPAFHPSCRGTGWSCWTALLGDDDQRAVSWPTWPPSASARARDAAAHRAADAMEAGAWLEVVLSWPRRFMA